MKSPRLNTSNLRIFPGRRRAPCGPFLLLILALAIAACSPATTQETPVAPPTTEGQPPATIAAPTAEPTATEAPPATETSTPSGAEDPLGGTQWTLVSFETAGEETPVAEGTKITLQFEEGGQAGGSGGCNSYGTGYQVEGNALSFGAVESTAMACVDVSTMEVDVSTMEQEERYYAALNSAGEFEVGGDRLTIWYDEGQGALHFVAAPAQEATAPAATAPPQAGQPLQIGRIHMLDANQGWATGRLGDTPVDRILFTADGGQTWQDRTPQDAPVPGASQNDDQGAGLLQEISATAFFASPRSGWVSYSLPHTQAPELPPQVWFTADEGQTWQASAPLDLSGMPFEFFLPSDLGFLDGGFGWLLAHLGAGMSHDYVAIFTTADGGQTWQRVTDPDRNPDIQGCQKSALLVTGERDGWLAGNCPGLMPPLFLYRTADGGATWSRATLPAPQEMEAGDAGALGNRCGVPQMTAVGPQTLLLTLHCPGFQEDTSRSWLYATADGGQSWQTHPLPGPSAVFHFISPEEGWLLASDPAQAEAQQQVLYTTDGGRTWDALAQLPGQGQLELDFVDTRNGWIVTGYAGEGGRTLWRTVDGGQTWQEVTPTLTP